MSEKTVEFTSGFATLADELSGLLVRDFTPVMTKIRDRYMAPLAERAWAESGLQVRTDVSTTVFLSEPEEYEGGELIVEDTYGEHEVKLAAGDAIVYPATSLHRVEPVTAGARIAAFLWTQSWVRDAWQRKLLFDLDMNILKLRGQLGDSEEVLGLTSTYHNLLRQWGE